MVIKSEKDLIDAFNAPCVVEELVNIDKELSVIVARNAKNEIVSYPTVECEFSEEANLVEFLFSPANVSNEIEEKAKEMAINLIQKLDMIGILAVEFFQIKMEN